MSTTQEQRKADIDPNFDKQLNNLQKLAKDEAEKRVKGNQVKWMLPEKGDWDGDLFNWDDMLKKGFNRDKANEDFVKATQDKQSPGVTGDLIITTTQIDYLAIMGRAFAARHTMSFNRAVALASGRKKGHGDPSLGLFKKGIFEYVRALIKQSSGKVG